MNRQAPTVRQHATYQDVLDAPPNMDPQTIEKWVTTEANYDSMHAALYYPWLTIANPLPGQPAHSEAHASVLTATEALLVQQGYGFVIELTM